MCNRKEFERKFPMPNGVKFKDGKYSPLTKNGDYSTASDFSRIWELYQELYAAKIEINRLLKLTHNV